MSRRKLVCRLLVGGCLIYFGLEFTRVAFLTNVHTIFPDRVYRTAQLSPDQLREFVERHGIRTVVNLRGYCPQQEWYERECEVAQELNLIHEDVTLSASRMPPPGEIRRLIEVLDFAEYPIVIHCRQGADRTGLAGGIMALLYTDGGLKAARWQCGPRHGHLGIGPTANMGRFFKMYERFLRDHSTEHTPDRFRQWVNHVYTPGACAAGLAFHGEPVGARAGNSVRLPVVATNRSWEVWHLRPGTGSGVHMRYLVCDRSGAMVHTGRAGLFERQVGPGESVDLDIALPPLAAGTYVLHADMIDSDGTAFSQVGSEPLMRELVVTE